VKKGISNCKNIETLNVFKENFENFAETINALKCIRNTSHTFSIKIKGKILVFV
jgi:hypothetical protein